MSDKANLELRVIGSSGGSIRYYANGELYTNWTVDENGERHEEEFFKPDKFPRPENPCRVYWGSHGCHLERGHEGHHMCDCCDCEVHTGEPDEDNIMCVATFPYYGPDTHFYGEDSPDGE